MADPADGAGLGSSELDWAIGIEELADGLYRVPLPVAVDGLRAVNVYVLRGPGGVDLVDAGDAQATTIADLDAALRPIGARVEDIRNVYVTHVHPDHYTLALPIRRHSGATVHLGVGERPALDAVGRLIRGERESNVGTDLVRVGADGLRSELEPERLLPKISADAWGEPDRWIGDRETVAAGTAALLAQHTPGHTRGHLVYRDLDRGLCFTGDHVLPHITPSVGFESEPVPSALTDYLRSLQAMLGQPDARMLPAHGPVRASTHERVRELLAHHHERLGATLDAVRPAGSTPYDVARQLPWTSRRRQFAELTPWHRYLASTETSVHLMTLLARGQVRRRPGTGDIEVFEPVAQAARPTD